MMPQHSSGWADRASLFSIANTVRGTQSSLCAGLAAGEGGFPAPGAPLLIRIARYRFTVTANEGKFLGPSVSRPAAAFMRRYARIQIIGMASIEITVTAIQDVCPKRHGTALKEMRPFDKLGANGVYVSVQETITGTLAAAGRVDKSLAEQSGLSRERVKALMAEGAVIIGKTTATNPSAKMQAGAHFTITVPAATQPEAQPQDIPLDIAFEDEHLIVINKPAGMVVHPAAGNLNGTLVNALLHHCRGELSGIGGVARPGIVHRIDKDTSGLLVVAKSTAAHEGLAKQFADHSIQRRYLAICAGHPMPLSGTIEGIIGRAPGNRKKMAVLNEDSPRGKHAITHYKVIENLSNSSLIECRLETGRTHQVRVHCASIGHALLGDPAYGRTPTPLRPILQRLRFVRQALHAASLGFDHPISGDFVEFEAELPDDMRELIDETTRSNR